MKKEILSICSDGVMPTQRKVTFDLGHTPAILIARYYGGYRAIASKLNLDYQSQWQSKDGHYLNSSYEVIVDNFLFDKKIPHEVDQKIHRDYFYKYDFKIDDYFIEIWGYDTNRKRHKRTDRYRERRKIKEQLYTDLGLKLIPIEGKIFDDNSKNIESKLETIFSHWIGV